jgi:hypothetical protein
MFSLVAVAFNQQQRWSWQHKAVFLTALLSLPMLASTLKTPEHLLTPLKF